MSGSFTATSRKNSHCAAKFVTIDSERESASMRCTCARSTPGSRSEPELAACEQLVVGDAAPEEERQARCELDVADGERAGFARLALDAIQELRAHEQALERELNPGVEAALGAAHLVERHEIGDVGVGRRPPISAARERAQNLARAQLASSPAPLGRQTKMRLRLGVSPGAGRLVRPANRRHRDRGQRAAAAHAAARDALVERLGALDERDADQVRAGRERHAERHVLAAAPLARAAAASTVAAATRPPSRLSSISCGSVTTFAVSTSTAYSASSGR